VRSVTDDEGSAVAGPAALNSEALNALVGAGATVASCERAGPATVALKVTSTGWQVVAWAPAGTEFPDGLVGEVSPLAGGSVLIAVTNGTSAAALRRHVPWLRPQRVLQGTSIGLGDRLGLAGPGHIRALRGYTGIAPVLAQQSARELARTRRTFADVLDAATFAAMAEGWRDGYGADADHLRSVTDVETAVAGGFTSVTADPGELIVVLPGSASRGTVAGAYQRVPWAALDDDEVSFAARYPAYLETDMSTIPLPADALKAAAARFGAAVVLLVAMYHRLEVLVGPHVADFEVAVDETPNATTLVDHVYLATELGRLGVRWTKLAPRFVGRFEKGTDYLGDPAALEADVAGHAAVARRFGNYRLSVHSGSDKFSIYERLQRATRGHVHIKTSGTSYLEALRTVAKVEPQLFRRAWSVSKDSYEVGRSSYLVSAHLRDMPDVDSFRDQDLPGLFAYGDVREVLHVGFGAVLAPEPLPRDAGDVGGDLNEALRACLWANRERYWSDLQAHMGRHLAPLLSDEGSDAANQHR
jgi:tagaturonate epimerase